MRLSDFQDAIRKLEPWVLEVFVVDLLRRSKGFCDVRLHQGPMERGYGIQAIKENSNAPNPGKWVFEVKSVKVVGRDLIARLIAQWQSIRHTEPGSELVLVSAGHIPLSALEALDRPGIHVWDSIKLFGLATPELLADYFGSGSIAETLRPTADEASQSKAAAFSEALKRTATGKEQWSIFQRLCGDILEFLFCPPLETPRYDISEQDAKKRGDMIFENTALDGFWAGLRTTYSAQYIVADAKNYSAPITKRPVMDIALYLKPYGCGRFAMLVTRRGASVAALHAIREHWIGSQKMIVVLSDDDIHEMLTMKGRGERPEEIIRGLIADFRMGL